MTKTEKTHVVLVAAPLPAEQYKRLVAFAIERGIVKKTGAPNLAETLRQAVDAGLRAMTSTK